jgi:hypothetical protein
MLGWARCGLYKKLAGTRYVELVFLHPVGFAGLVLHSGASRACNDDTLFFMLEWGQGDFRKKRVGIQYTELVLSHPVISVGLVVHSGASGP